MRRREALKLIGAALVTLPTAAMGQSSRTTAYRIVVIANKTFEADPLMAVLGNDWARNPGLGIPREVLWPRAKPQDAVDIIARPRCLVDVGPQATPSATIEIWCIDDLMTQAVNHSSSDNKAQALNAIADFGPTPDGVIAFGTGAFPGDLSKNGCVAVGSTIYVHDAAGGQSHWSWAEHIEKLVPSKTPPSFYSSVASDQQSLKNIHDRMLNVPVNPAADHQLIISADAVAISSVNIASSADYAKIDSEAIALAKAAGATTITSVETTHGIIRAEWPEAAFIYVTGIPNRVGHFPDEANGSYPQNFAAAHNAGIAASFLIPAFLQSISH
jgi:hypothetical protein